MLAPMSGHRFAPAFALCIPLAFTACDKGQEVTNPDTATPQDTPAPAGPAFELSSESEIGQEVIAQMDLSINPCDDFYQFACGSWIANTPLPDDKPRWGRGFGELAERNDAVLREILEADEGRAGAYYRSCMDEAAIDAAGIEPLKPFLSKIDKLKVTKTKQLFAFIGEMDASLGLGALFEVSPFIDFKQPDLHIANLGQGGTTLPNPAYYLDEQQSAQILPLYEAHIARMLAFIGYAEADAKAAAGRIIAFETELAKIQKLPEEMRDPEKVYNRWDRKGLKDKSKLPWDAYFKGLKAPKVEAINVSNPEFVTGLEQVLAGADEQTLRDYLRFFMLSSAAGLLGKDVVEAEFMFTAAFTGQQQLEPRSKRCISAVNWAVGDLLSEQFIARSFPGDSKDIATDMIERVEGAFEAGLPGLAWMDDPTREAAVGKMNKIENKIGYPEKWKTYEGLEFSGTYFEDALAARTWSTRYQIDKVGTKVDEQEWNWPASIVNASYNPLQNFMNFPAGILQPPFFHRDFPKAMNFGAMGMVMGHELTHGFDDSGRKFDGDGVMREWWAPEVASAFEQQTQCVVETYSALEVQPGVHVKGELTLGENIADFGGLKESYAAYQAWVAEQGPEPQLIDGLSNEQLFFVAHAQSWCSVASPEFEQLLVNVDPHSPPAFRVNIPNAHFSGFWDAFSCEEGTPMHPEQVCAVW